MADDPTSVDELNDRLGRFERSLERFAIRIEDVELGLAADDRLPVDVDITTADTSSAGDNDKDDDQAPDTYKSEIDWVADWFAKAIERSSRGRGNHWCDMWWDHPEGRHRLCALWRAWEHAQKEWHDDGSAMAHWWVEYADPMLTRLRADDGPFASCHDGEHSAREPLPVARISAG